jgi:hypothetical protein
MSSTSAPPKITDDLLELFASGVDMYVATRSADSMPESQVAMGLRVHADRRTMTVYVPTTHVALTLANLADNGQIAVTVSHPPDHRTVQLKGRSTGVRESTDADRAIQEVCRAALVDAFAVVGIPRALTRSMPWWPSTAIELELRDIYLQTPGPNAGERMPT